MHEPVPGEGAFAEAAERTQAQQRIVGVRVQPGGEHGALGEAAGEVGRHGIGMGQEPAVGLRLLWRFGLQRRTQRGQKLAPGEVEVRAGGEINVGERANIQRLLTGRLEQRDDAEVAIGWAEGLSHDAFKLAPLALDVLRREYQKRLAAREDAAFYFLDARRAAREVAKINERLKSGLLDAPQ